MSQHVVLPALSLLTLLLASPALAKVVLPNGKDAPDPDVYCNSGSPGGLSALFAAQCTVAGIQNIGKPCPGSYTPPCDEGKNGTCESRIWYNWNSDPCIPTNIDQSTTSLVPKRDATTKPETFRPVCPMNFTLISRGSAMFQNAFGWYNVVAGKKPDFADLHTRITCTSAKDTTITLDPFTEPSYKGGDVGFFIVTPEDPAKKGACAKGDCCATVARAQAGEGYIYYSQPQYNPDYNGSSSYLHLLLFTSKIKEHKFYFAWEDTYNGTTTDFSDFVTSVVGVNCSGAGLKCDTGQKGICGFGVGKCDSDGKVTCEGAYKVGAEKEVCDGLDNDCDGTVDNGATCQANYICYQGSCIPKCYDSEFPCMMGYQCDKTTGYCVETACKSVTCKSGEVCKNGKCGNGCDGVVCPEGQLCQAGVCVDPCLGRVCKVGEICKFGVCLPDCTKCGGVTCPLPLACDKTTGDCYQTGCTPACASGTTCKNAKCVSVCDGVKCPGNMTCKVESGKAKCPPPGIGTKSDGGVPGQDSGLFADSGSEDSQVSGSEGGPKNKAFYEGDGCSCTTGRASGGATSSAGLMILSLLGLLGLVRRRR